MPILEPVERLREMVDSERAYKKTIEEALEELAKADALAEALTEMVDLVHEAKACLDLWGVAGAGEDKMDARIDLLEAIGNVAHCAEFTIGEADIPDWLMRELTVKRLKGREADG